MAFSSTSQVDNLRLFEVYYASIFKGTAGASGNTFDVNFAVDYILGAPNLTFTQSGATVTVSGLTNTSVYTLVPLGRSPL